MSSNVDTLKESATALAQAARCTGQAAAGLAKGLAPAARQGAATLTSRAEQRLAPLSSKNATVLVASCAVATVGIAIAGIAHIAYHRKTARFYRARKREARAWEDTVLDVFGEASYVMAAPRFEELYGSDALQEAAEDVPEALPDELSDPGCFAILSFEEEDDDIFMYRNVYVGAGRDMAASAHQQLSGHGNLYVAADVAYGQSVQVLFFPCGRHEVYAYREQLIDALEAEHSYNRISDIAEVC